MTDTTKKPDTPAAKAPAQTKADQPKAPEATAGKPGGKPAAKEAKPAEQYALVRAAGVERRCRSGMCFNAEGTVLARSALTDAQWRAIAEDDHLKVEPAKAPEASEPAEAPDANGEAQHAS